MKYRFAVHFGTLVWHEDEMNDEMIPNISMVSLILLILLYLCKSPYIQTVCKCLRCVVPLQREREREWKSGTYLSYLLPRT